MIRDRGFTLIEVLVAMLIVAVAAPLIIGVITGSLTYSRRSQDRGEAVAWVQGEVDFLRRQCYRDLILGGYKIAGSTPPPGGGPQLPPGFPAAYVSLEDPGTRTELVRATVSVYKVDWGSGPPPSAVRPVLAATTYITDIKARPGCDRP